MFILNSDELCVYNLLCNSTEILLKCFDTYIEAFNYIKDNSF